MTKDILKAEFTKFDNTSQWVSGKIGNYVFDAKLFDQSSTFGIKNGRVSKLSIYDEMVRQEKKDFFAASIVNYDRGWDIKPTKENKPIFEAVMQLLEESPKRWEEDYPN